MIYLSKRMRRSGGLIGRLTLATLMLLAPPVHAQKSVGATKQRVAAQRISAKPLVLVEQGSFFVNEQRIETRFAGASETATPGHISARGMYVQYQIPHRKRVRDTKAWLTSRLDGEKI